MKFNFNQRSDISTMIFLSIICILALASSPGRCSHYRSKCNEDKRDCWPDARFSLVRQLSGKHYPDGYKVLSDGEDYDIPHLKPRPRSSRPLFSWDFITPAPASLKALVPDISEPAISQNNSRIHPSPESKKLKQKKNKSRKKHSSHKSMGTVLNNQTWILDSSDRRLMKEFGGSIQETRVKGIQEREDNNRTQAPSHFKKEKRRKNKHRKDRTGKKKPKSERRKGDRHKKQERKSRRKGRKPKDNNLISNSLPALTNDSTQRHKLMSNLEVVNSLQAEHETIHKTEIVHKNVPTTTENHRAVNGKQPAVHENNKVGNSIDRQEVSGISDSLETNVIKDNILLPILFPTHPIGNKYPEIKSVNVSTQSKELIVNNTVIKSSKELTNLNSSKINRTEDEEFINNSLPNELDANVPYQEVFHQKSILPNPAGSNNTLEVFNRLNFSSHNKNHSEENHAVSSRDGQNLTGDLSCLAGTFLPAPTVLGGAIKYIRTQMQDPLQATVFLIAEYECQPQYHLNDPKIYQLVCSQRHWIGVQPTCIPDEEVNHIPKKECVECDHICQIVAGTKICSCYKGFRLDGNVCKDINECEYSNGGCEFGCHNTLGSYHCNCPVGLRLADDGKSCVDINECLLRNGHGPCQDSCHNLWGGYECNCGGIAGTRLAADNHTCEDVDECADGTAGCSHTCLNTLGSAFCLCPAGFMLGDDWKTCQDINECLYEDLQTEHCKLGCVNTVGSYHCLEEEEDSIALQRTATELPVTCPVGMRAGLDGNCEDIDECEEKLSGCTQSCLNTNGSFQCICGLGFSLSRDNKTCIDGAEEAVCPPLDSPHHGYLECARHLVRMRKTRFPWMKRARVVNHAGSICQLKCPHGFVLEGEFRKTCGQDKRWTGPENGTCVPLPAPSIRCPSNMTVSIKPGKSTAYVTIPQPITNVNWFRYVDATPAWGKSLEARLPVGHWEIKFTARHPTSHLTSSCILIISVG